MGKRYILEGHEPVEVDATTWARWLETNQDQERVALDQIGDTKVSTAFFGLDLSFGGERTLLFETMTIGGDLSDERDRYTTWDEAVAGHAAMCERVRRAQYSAEPTP
jgi:hypothetical protein